MTYDPKDTFTVNPGQNSPITPISQAAATKIIGAEGMKQASSAEGAGMAFHTLYGMTQTGYDHPVRVLGGAAPGAAPVPQFIIVRPDQMPDAPYRGPA